MREVCYNLLGCFNNNPPYHRHELINVWLPEPPSITATRHLVYSRAHRHTPVTVSYKDKSSVKDVTSIDPSLPLKVIIHGYLSDSTKKYYQDMKDLLLDKEGVNVYMVDWRRGAARDYFQAVANLRGIAAEVELVLLQFVSEGLSLDLVHIIGVSLGAHMAGKIGQRSGGLVGRITGLDPASPAFEGFPPEVRLDESDAMFVDVIHTDAVRTGRPGLLLRGLFYGLGTFEKSGHLDVYVNGGMKQPGCTDGLRLTYRDVVCSHIRSIHLFIESINSVCPLTTYTCNNLGEFERGQCLDCTGRSSCNSLGYHSNSSRGLGAAFLNTHAVAPFCGFHHHVTLNVLNTVKGSVQVVLTGTKVSLMCPKKRWEI